MKVNARPRFIYNLRKSTLNPFVLDELRPRGYLLSQTNSTPGFRALAESAIEHRRDLFLDNGNFSIIGRLRSQLAGQAAILRKRITELRADLDRFPRPTDIPPDLESAFRQLASQAQQLAADQTPSDESILSNQLSFEPSQVIGVEDITMAVWLSLDIEPGYVNFPRHAFLALNQKVADRAIQALETQVPTDQLDGYYPVASAVSHDTAFDAGQVFGKAGIERISMGFGAFMADNNFTDHLFRNEIRRDLDGPVPTRYIRTVGVAKGFWDGYQSVTGTSPKGFHFLGLGAPIMIPLVTFCGRLTRDLSFDATSPIKDAVSGGTIYVTKPAYLKVRTRKVSFRLASDKERVWDCPCPFCNDFVSRHPFRYEIGHKWFTRENGRPVEARDLRPEGDLFEAYPLFSEPSGGSLRKEVNFSRSGHNHWALETIIRSVRNASRDQRLETRTKNIVKTYSRNTSQVFSRALELSLSLATETS